VAEKKSPIHISIFARLSIMGTTATLWRTHLTIHLDVSTQNTVSSRGCSNVMPLSNQLSIDFCAVSKAYHGVKGSQNVRLCLQNLLADFRFDFFLSFRSVSALFRSLLRTYRSFLRTYRSSLRTFRSSARHSLQRCGAEQGTSAAIQRQSGRAREQQRSK